MDIRKLFTQRVNILFGFACLIPIVQTVISLPTELYTLIRRVSGSPALTATETYWVSFVLPQFLYPIVMAIVFLGALKMMKIKPKAALERQKTPISEYLIYIPMGLFVSNVISTVINAIFAMFAKIGINLPTVEGYIPDPRNGLEVAALFFVMAFLPAVCEEFIYRVVFVKGLSPISKGGAIVLSSIAFGFMHATLQQIPFAFCLGLILAFAYIRTGDHRVPIIMHFANNCLSCISITLMSFFPEDTYALISKWIVLAIFICGIAATVTFFVKEKKEERLPSGDSSQIKTGESLFLAMKAPLFWIFIVIFASTTAITTALYASIQ